MRILLVDDEKHLAEAVAQVLKRNKYAVDLAFDGVFGLDCALSGIYDLIILDIMLPKMDGISVLTELRSSGLDTPVILLTANGETSDKVRGLDCGADDYLAKPFRMEELLARLRALGRRMNVYVRDGILTYGDLEYSPYSLDLRCGTGVFRLTLKEGQLMELLLRNRGVILPASLIIEKVWGYETETEDSHVQVYISFLRKKLSRLSSQVRIQTVRGAGYQLTGDGDVRDNV